MANGSSQLTYAQIENISSNLKREASEMQTLLNEIQREMGNVGDGGVWSGTSAEKSYSEFKVLIDKFPEFVSLINSCSDRLDKVVASYKEADARIQGLN